MFQCIEGWYNPSQWHSALGYQYPVNFEEIIRKQLKPDSPELLTTSGELNFPVI
ncbi:MAG: hypothetical protein H6905_02945 [Hyphomicrobiales bacterium]|nr:hypothetical protein [Hyphomicrobiales bacterium]